MRSHYHLGTAVLAGLLLIGGALTAPATAASTGRQTTRVQPTAVPIAGIGHAVAHAVTVRAAMARADVQANTGSHTMLGLDGKPAGSALPSIGGTGGRPSPDKLGNQAASAALTPLTAQAGGAGALPSAAPAAPIRGATQGGSGCSDCQTPDVTAAVNATQIAETVNLQLQVFAKSGTSVCSVGLASLLGALTGLSGPRIQYDNANKRFSLLIDSVPASGSDAAIQYLAASQTDDACGAWWVYSIVFPVTSTYPLGALLDFPYLGQDSTSILSSTNNYAFGGSYLGSAAYAIPKAAAYSGNGFSVTTYKVAFSTAPVTVAGIPIAATSTTYWLAAVPGAGYDVYAMPTSPAGAVFVKAVIRAPFSAPTRRIRQPGTSQTLDPGDGRIGSAAVQDGSTIWFAHDVNDSGYPTVRYGEIDVASGQATTALAYHGNGSDDFNPSIAVSPVGDGTDYIWVNWAYTEPSAGVATSDTVAGVAPGQGVPELVGNDLTLVTGSSTSIDSGFGRYSSAQIDPAGTSSCAAGLTALTAQEYFTAAGLWTTDLERTTFC
jgi:hypothetical protein